MTKRSGVLFSIRTKLLLLSVVILSIPYIGFEYLRELERHLRDALETSLIDAAGASAAPFHNQTELFTMQTGNPVTALYIHDLEHALQIDGYSEDWVNYIEWAETYTTENENDLSFKLLAGRYRDKLYLLIRVRDQEADYRKAEDIDSLDNDHIVLVLQEASSQVNRYYFSPSSMGNLQPFRFQNSFNEFGEDVKSTEFVSYIKGAWQESADGYTVEIALPLSIVGSNLGVVVRDINRTQTRSLGTAGANTELNPGKLLAESEKIRRLIQRPGMREGRRIWVLNNLGQVLASYGGLDKNLLNKHRNIFYNLILPPVSSRLKDDLAGKSRLQGEDVKSALAGNTVSRWRRAADNETVIVSAATPIWVNDEVRGVVMVEESSSGIQMLQRNAMASLFNKTLYVFLFVTAVLLIFATRLSGRIKQLSAQAGAAIDEHGRVTGEFTGVKGHDEIHELSQNYSAMLERLRHYNHYLENMAGRLSHELRTPITVVQSSLERLQSTSLDTNTEQYISRARNGIEQLGLILTRLSEATRLEQAIQSASKQNTRLNEIVNNCCEGYRLAYAERHFELDITPEPLTVDIAPELFVQLMDKLIANAADFSQIQSSIGIRLRRIDAGALMEVSNEGPVLPEGMEDQLFNSMVSIRQGKSDGQAHLGLGLYIVRLIAEFHNGSVSARNLSSGDGVVFSVNIPLSIYEN